MPAEDIAGSQAPQARSLQAVLAQVEQYYAQKLRQTAVAAGCEMSSSAFSRAFKAEYGLTFSQYQMSYRIGRCLLLRQGSHSATSAGLAVGFEDASHFARAFRNLLGTSPSLYQRREHPLKPVTERRRHERALPGKSVLRKALRNLPLQRAGTRIDQAVESGLRNQHNRHVGQE
jgi:AraC-like DNA-binding protein